MRVTAASSDEKSRWAQWFMWGVLSAVVVCGLLVGCSDTGGYSNTTLDVSDTGAEDADPSTDGSDPPLEPDADEDVGPCSPEDQLNVCGGCEQLESQPGEPCGTCDSGTFECQQGLVVCEGDAGQQVLNTCGGCERLEIQPGEPCGTCDSGTFECQNDGVVCAGDGGQQALNDCGGCQPIDGAPGESCGTCGQGLWQCVEGAEEVECVGDFDNGCGGCEPLTLDLGSACGTCGSGQWTCDGAENVSCDGDLGADAFNACNGCGELPGQVGDACGVCGLGRYNCQDFEMVCQDPLPCPLGRQCEEDEHCAEGHCSRGVCSPEGLIFVEEGTFRMGAQSTEFGFREEYIHDVTLTRSFWIQQTESTQGQWLEMFGRNWALNQDCGLNCPMDNINWFEAAEFANRLSVSKGLEPCYFIGGCSGVIGVNFTCAVVDFFSQGFDCTGYRLPTEAEWEYAARADTTTPTPYGVMRRLENCGEMNLFEGAWFCGNSSLTTHPVGQLEPNPWGLYDMIGNVAELVWDWSAPYPRQTLVDPLGPDEAQFKIARGGYFGSNNIGCRVAGRGRFNDWNRGTAVGVRLVRTASEEDD
jgi:formylglycine-generating enzyme required for sulfatase activity